MTNPTDGGMISLEGFGGFISPEGWGGHKAHHGQGSEWIEGHGG